MCVKYLKGFACLFPYRWLLSWQRQRPPSTCSCTPWETRTTAGASGNSSPGRRSCLKKCLRLRTSPNKNSSSTLAALVISLWKVLLICLFVCFKVVRARGCCVCVQWFSGVCIVDLLSVTTAGAPVTLKGPYFAYFLVPPHGHLGGHFHLWQINIFISISHMTAFCTSISATVRV